MSERIARYVASGFAAIASLFVPAVTFVDMRPRWREVSRRGTNARSAFALGAVLMIIGFIQAVVTSRAT